VIDVNGGVNVKNRILSRISRRGFLGSAGAAAGIGAATVASGGVLAAPRSSGHAFQRNQDTTKLTFWGQFPELLDPFKAVMADFTAANPGIEIDVEMTTNDQYKTKIQSALNVGSGPDLYMVPAQPEMNNYVDAGTLVDLTGKLDLSQVIDVAVDAVTIDGKVWASPSGRYTVGICYHQDLFEQAGVTEEPTTWEEMRAVMQQLLDAGITPYSIAAKDGSLTYFNYIGLASSILGTEGFEQILSGEKKLTDDDMVGVIQEMRDWVPFYQKNFLGTPYAESKALFATSKTAMMDCGSADLSGYYEIDPGAKLGFFYWPAPTADSGSQVTNTGMSVMYGINPAMDEGKMDAALAFVNWVATPEGAQSMNKNIKLLPVVTGVEPEGDPILTEMVNSPLDIPVWYERWATLNIGTVWTTDGNSAFDTDTPPSDFAAKLQASVDEQMANAPAAATPAS
jgi:raffinose/stachyose/melibiose transport system substrate-binding protein